MALYLGRCEPRVLIALRIDVSDDIYKALVALQTDFIALDRCEYSAVFFNEVTAISESTLIEEGSELEETGCHQRGIDVLQSELSDPR